MNLMITRSAGFIGSRFAEMLIKQEIPNKFLSITVVDNLAYFGNLSNLESVISYPEFYFHEVDICNQGGIERVLNESS